VLEGNQQDSQLVRDGDEWFVHYTVETKHSVQTRYSDVIGVDLGTHHLATTVLLSDRSTMFYGKNIRHIREHYKQLKKSVGKAKITSGANWISDKCGEKESKRVKHELHRIANSIIEDAVENDAVIVVGNLEGLRYDNNKGRYVNDKTHQMPYSKFVNILEYKAEIAGVSVELVGEAYTSQTCNKCGEREETGRVGQGLFECENCGLEDNADKNGALNIVKRGLGKAVESPLSDSGVVVRQPETQVVLASESDQDEPVNSPLVVDDASSRARSPRL
jgi:putative transposase